MTEARTPRPGPYEDNHDARFAWRLASVAYISAILQRLALHVARDRPGGGFFFNPLPGYPPADQGERAAILETLWAARNQLDMLMDSFGDDAPSRRPGERQ